MAIIILFVHNLVMVNQYIGIADTSKAFYEGRRAAKDNGMRICPEHYIMLSDEWREWYKGYDSTGLFFNAEQYLNKA